MTELCNSQCKYCYEKSMREFENGLDKKFQFDFSAPVDFSADLGKLKKFILQDKNPVIIFYGGEPLLQIKKIKKIIDSLSDINVHFCMQTNAKLIDKLPKEYLNKFSKILVSIDGNKERTDFNRGAGTYDLVLKNLKLIRKNSFKEEIVARMTLSPLPKTNIDVSDICEQVKHLFSLGIFDSVHWQIDAGFYKNDYNKKDFSEFVKKYNLSVSKLLDFWISEMKNGKVCENQFLLEIGKPLRRKLCQKSSKNELRKVLLGKVLKIYPFLGIFGSLYSNTKTKLRCGAGYGGYAITTDGKIAACPIMNNISDFCAGDLNSKISELKKFDVISPCTECSYLNLCGGRCLYSNRAKLWPEKGQKLICSTIVRLIEEIKKRIPEIKRLISEGKIKISDFEYERYFGPEIIP